jgi:16S rRNA (cytidine1402-2'-O)-methyltransferase
MTATQKGRLFLVPAPLDFGCDVQQNITDSLPMATLQTAANIQHWVCENAKTTRAFLKRVNDICPLSQPLQSLSIQELPREVHKKGDHAGSLGEGF